jgi:hypothetical protein
MEPQSSHSLGSRAEPWIALALCAVVLAAGALEQLVRNRPAHAETFAPDWLPLAAAGLAARGPCDGMVAPSGSAYGGRCIGAVFC